MKGCSAGGWSTLTPHIDANVDHLRLARPSLLIRAEATARVT
jgi:hypothetical protein